VFDRLSLERTANEDLVLSRVHPAGVFEQLNKRSPDSGSVGARMANTAPRDDNGSFHLGFSLDHRIPNREQGSHIEDKHPFFRPRNKGNPDRLEEQTLLRLGVLEHQGVKGDSIQKNRIFPGPSLGMIGVGDKMGLSGMQELLKNSDALGEVFGALFLEVMGKSQIRLGLEPVDHQGIEGGRKTFEGPPWVQRTGL